MVHWDVGQMMTLHVHAILCTVDIFFIERTRCKNARWWELNMCKQLWIAWMRGFLTFPFSMHWSFWSKVLSKWWRSLCQYVETMVGEIDSKVQTKNKLNVMQIKHNYLSLWKFWGMSVKTNLYWNMAVVWTCQQMVRQLVTSRAILAKSSCYSFMYCNLWKDFWNKIL